MEMGSPPRILAARETFEMNNAGISKRHMLAAMRMFCDLRGEREGYLCKIVFLRRYWVT